VAAALSAARNGAKVMLLEQYGFLGGLVTAALCGGLEGVPMRTDPYFSFAVPESCPGLPADILNPRQTGKTPRIMTRRRRRWRLGRGQRVQPPQ
jgi:hypothetical protein